MLNSEQNDEGCDTTEDDSSNAVGQTFFVIIVRHIGRLR